MGTDACCAPQSGLGRDAGSPEKEPIHCLLEGHNLGGSCCGGEEPASSTLALPSNPSQPWPEGQTVPASPGALLPRSPSGCAGYVSGAASKCSSSDAPLKKKKIAELINMFRAAQELFHTPPRNLRRWLPWAQTADEDGWVIT